MAVFVPGKKQLIVHDLKYLKQRVVNLKDVEHPFGNFSSILQSSLNGVIYICGGKQRKKLFEFEEASERLIERQDMHFGRSNHAFIQVKETGELVAIGGWDGEKSMSQVEGYSISRNQWRVLPRLVEDRHSLSACQCQNFVYAIGGSSAINYGSSLSTIERLDFSQPDFSNVSHWELIFLFGEYCDTKRSQLGSFAVAEDKIMIFGGFLDTDLTNMCFLIDTNTFDISRLDCMMSKSKKFIKFKDFNLTLGNKVYVVDDENEIHAFDTTNGQWSIVDTLREQPRMI